VVRDDCSAMFALGVKTYDVVVMDTNLKITYRGGPAYSSTTKTAAVNAIKALIP